MKTIPGMLRVCLLGVIVTGTACDDAGAGDVVSNARVDTMPSGAIHVTNNGEPAWTPAEAWTLVEDLRLGSLDGSGPSLFSQVAAILTDPQGQVYVLDYPSQEIRVFSGTGQHLRTMGGEGQGPGELTDAAGLNWAPDGRLWVWGSRLIWVLEPTGEEVARYQRLPRGVIYSWQGGFDDQGRYIDWGLDREMLSMSETATGGIERTLSGRTMMYPIVFTPPDQIDTLHVLDFYAEVTEAGQLRRNGTSMEAVLDGGHYWYVRTNEYAVYKRSLSGDTILVFTLPRQPEPVPTSEIDSLIAAQSSPNRPRPTHEDYVPFRWVVTKVIPDRAGHVFVFPYPAGTAVDVFEDSGRYLGQISVPAPILVDRPAPWIDGDHLYAVEPDAFNVPFVVRYRIEKP